MNSHSEPQLDVLRNIQPMELGVKQADVSSHGRTWQWQPELSGDQWWLLITQSGNQNFVNLRKPRSFMRAQTLPALQLGICPLSNLWIKNYLKCSCYTRQANTVQKKLGSFIFWSWLGSRYMLTDGVDFRLVVIMLWWTIVVDMVQRNSSSLLVLSVTWSSFHRLGHISCELQAVWSYMQRCLLPLFSTCAVPRCLVRWYLWDLAAMNLL